MHPELGQKLKHLEKLLSETEKVAKRYLAITGKCSTELDDDDKGLSPHSPFSISVPLLVSPHKVDSQYFSGDSI